MRIGLVCPYSWDVPGGVQEHIRDLAEALIDLGHDVSVISPADEEHVLPGYVVPAGRAVAVPYNGSVARLSFGPLTANRVRRWVKDGNFDLLHVHEPAAPSLSLLACWVADIPIVATVHGANLRSRVLHVAEPMLRSALGEDQRLDRGVRGGPVHARAASGRRRRADPQRGDDQPVREGRAAARLAWGRRRDRVPRPDGRAAQGPADPAARVRDRRRRTGPGLRLLIAGPGDVGRGRGRVPAALRDRVVLLGQVSEAVKVQVYHSVDVFCAPNTGGESFGIVLAEAMAAGAPIVASDLDAFRRVLRGGRAGELFDNGNAEDLAAAIGRLLDDPQRRAALSAAASAAVRDYDWPKIARDVVQGLRGRAAGRRAPLRASRSRDDSAGSASSSWPRSP